MAELHGDFYHRQWAFGLFFEAKVAKELAAFFSRYDAARDGFWAVVKKGRLEGAIVIDGQDATGEGAHLRWFIVSDGLRGQGAGRRLSSKQRWISAAVNATLRFISGPLKA